MSGRNLKGFFFVLISFILLTYILFSTSMWVRAIETSEQTYSDAFRAYTVTMMADQVSEERMARYSDIISHYALFSISNHSIYHPLRPGEEDQISHIRDSYLELISTCTTSPDHFADNVPLTYIGEDASTYCFAGFASQLNSSLSVMGFAVEEFTVSDLTFNETEHPLQYTTNMTIYLKIKDFQTETSIDRTYQYNGIIDAEGMVDPLVARESLDLKGEAAKENLTIFKGVYMYPPPREIDDFEELTFEQLHEVYAEAHMDVYPDSKGTGSEGQGWFYGPMVLVEDASKVPEAYRARFILVGNYSDIRETPNWREFGAYVLLNKPEDPGGCSDQHDTFNPISREEDGGRCEERIDDASTHYTSKPFMVYEDFIEDVYDEVYYKYYEPLHSAEYERRRILFISEYSASEILSDPDRKESADPDVFDIEMFRDYVRCSYYILSEPGKSPSYLQRMLDGEYGDFTSDTLGIETTLVGKYAGGVYNPELDELSRVDREFFTDEEGEKVRGMPGCKDQPMCVNPNSDVGHFALTMDSMEFYFGVEDREDEENIGCNDERASCEES